MTQAASFHDTAPQDRETSCGKYPEGPLVRDQDYYCCMFRLKGLKAYFSASLSTANVSTAGVNWYGTGTTLGNAALGSAVMAGVSYSRAPFYVETGFRYNNYDDKVTDGITKKDPSFDSMLKISYTLLFWGFLCEIPYWIARF